MSEICATCGLPKELCVCEAIAKEKQRINVYIEAKKFKREYTIVDGVDPKSIDMKELIKKLKNFLACGGTIKEGKIELQGDHRKKMRQALTNTGFAPEMIDIT